MGTDGSRGEGWFFHLFSYKAIRNQMNWLFILQISGTWIGSLPHQQTHSIQLTHPILQAGSNMKCCIAIVSLEKTMYISERDSLLCRSGHLWCHTCTPWIISAFPKNPHTFALTKDRQLGSSKKRRMSSRFASSAAKCKAERPLLRSY